MKDKSTVLCQTKCLPSIISIVTNNIRFNLLEVYPSVLLFVFALSFIPSSNFLSGYFDVSVNLVAVCNVWILIHFVTQPQVFKSDSRAIVCHSYQGLPATIIIISIFNENNNRLSFYRYGCRIELVRFKEHYEMPRGHEHIPIYSLSINAHLSGHFFLKFPRIRL